MPVDYQIEIDRFHKQRHVLGESGCEILSLVRPKLTNAYCFKFSKLGHHSGHC